MRDGLTEAGSGGHQSGKRLKRRRTEDLAHQVLLLCGYVRCLVAKRSCSRLPPPSPSLALHPSTPSPLPSNPNLLPSRLLPDSSDPTPPIALSTPRWEAPQSTRGRSRRRELLSKGAWLFLRSCLVSEAANEGRLEAFWRRGRESSPLQNLERDQPARATLAIDRKSVV